MKNQPRLFYLLPFVCWIWVTLSAYGAQVIQIEGDYTLTHYAGGEPLPQKEQINFAVSLAGNKWEICATNQDKREWEVLMFDGTNNYNIMPFASHFTLSTADKNIFGTPSGESSFYGTVSPGMHYNLTALSFVYMYFPWMVYCLSTESIDRNWPLPWGDYTSLPTTYGFRWDVTPLDDAFIKTIKFTRGSSLDLTNEFSRPFIRYPTTPDFFQMAQRGIALRKAIADGTVVSTYSCKEWCNTNNILIPTIANLNIGFYNKGKISTARELVLKVNNVAIKEGSIDVPILPEDSYVRDYRYYLRADDKTFPYAIYSNVDSWKSENNPELLAQREHYLKYGPKDGNYGISGSIIILPERIKIVLVWSLLMLPTLVAIIILIRTKIKKTKTTEEKT